MKNYLQHISQLNVFLDAPEQIGAIRNDERFKKYTRKVVCTWVDVYIDLKKAPSIKRGAFFMVFNENVT